MPEKKTEENPRERIEREYREQREQDVASFLREFDELKKRYNITVSAIVNVTAN